MFNMKNLSEIDHKIIRAYLIERHAHRWIEDNILNIPSEKHLGFTARKRLLTFGLDKTFKNFLADIDSEKKLENKIKQNRDLIQNANVSERLLRFIWEESQQIYIFQRVIRNNDGWIRPTSGRLGFPHDGDYLRENGFGHEDWNFNTSLEIQGNIYGYLYYRPAESKFDKKFNIVFCERLNNGKWSVAGFYKNASFVEEGSPLDIAVIKQKISDLQLLRKQRSIGQAWNKDENEMEALLKKELAALRWRVQSQDVLRLELPIEIPPTVMLPNNDRITTPSEIEKSVFLQILELSQKKISLIESDDEESFPEGRVVWGKHKKRERDPKIVKKAKDIFLAKHGHFFCQVCNFNFEEIYGDLGKNFIEAHHVIPVSELKEDGETFIKDIVMLCSNCHRMIHRKRPWISHANLKNLMSKS
jgi:5-methylcytosine-specific restriction protein A